MSTGDAPAPAPLPSEQVTASPPAPAAEASTTIQPLQPSPAKTIAPAPAGFLARLRILDFVILFLVAAFALQTGLFRAFNSDIYLHLAAGRSVANGEPFAVPDRYTFTADRVWVNHSWLPDLIAYQIYRLPNGDSALVVLKAVLIALLALLLARAGSLSGRPLWIPVVCVLLAALAMSTRLLLQSTVLSFFMLGVLMLVLRQVSEGKWSPWLLPVVCLVWVNLDAWFLLGPIAIALFVLGEWLQRATSDEGTLGPARPLVMLTVALGVSVAACLVNPYHVGAFALPTPIDFSETITVVGREVQFNQMFLAPWEPLYFHRRIGLSAAGLSYFLLLAVGLASFALTAPAWKWWRVLVWLAFAGLSLWNYRAIPFFAVVAAPITALNLLDAVARFLGTELKGDLQSRQFAVAGRVLTCAVVLILALVGIPGLLQAEPHSHRQFGVGIHVDEGLRDAAEQVARWREQGALPSEAHFFNTSPEAVNYFAWFCPGERGFFDFRVNLFPADRAREYFAVRKAFSGEQLPGEDEKQQRRAPAWRKPFADNRIDFVVFHVSEMSFVSATLQRLYGDPNEFVPCHVSGSTAIFAWRKADSPPLDARLSLRPEVPAFGKEPVQAPVGRVEKSTVRTWYQEFLPVATRSTRQRDTAWQYREWFDAMQRPYAEQLSFEVECVNRVATIGLGGNSDGLGPVPVLLATRWVPLHMARMSELVRDRDRGPGAALYLGVRHLRHASNESENDPMTYLILAQTYAQLHQGTREASRSQGFPFASVLRQHQTMVALRAALDSSPRPEIARTIHLLMAISLRSPLFFESKVLHLSEYIKLSKQLGPTGSITGRQFKDMLEAAEQELKQDRESLDKRLNLYAVNSAQKKSADKIQVALRNGLSETAIKAVNEASKDVNVEGVQNALDLFLGLGRVKEARDILNLDEQEDAEDKLKRRRSFGAYAPGLPAYDWFAFLTHAAQGDYSLADRVLVEAGDFLRKNQAKEVWLWSRFQNPPIDRDFERGQRLAEFSCLRGLLALESGQLALAAEQARLSLRQSLALEDAAPGSQGTRPLAELIEELSGRGKKQ